MPTIRWGVIGVGRFGRVHCRALRGLPGVELRAVCKRNPEELSAVAAEFAVPQATADYREMLADPEIDAVSVTTHWQEHFAIAQAALSAGKHVLLEKPMAATSQQCQQLVAAAADARGYLMVGHICRFDPRVTQAKQAIEDGQIGRIISMHARRNLPTAPGSLRLEKISPLMGDGIHDADLMMWFTGRAPQRVYGRTVRAGGFRYPDVGWAMLEFGSDCIGVVETAWCLPPTTPYRIDARLEVIGTEGAIYVDCANTGFALHNTAGVRYPDTVYWPQQHGRMIGALSAELSYFADCIRSGAPPRVITPEEAARAVRVIEAAECSAASGRVEAIT